MEIGLVTERADIANRPFEERLLTSYIGRPLGLTKIQSFANCAATG
jgi:hypothetical protein